jgi:hypothetical protein
MFLDIFKTIINEVAERANALHHDFLYLTGKNPLRFINTNAETTVVSPDNQRFAYLYLDSNHEFSASRKKMSSCSSTYDVRHQLNFIVYDECLNNYELAYQYLTHIDTTRSQIFTTSNVTINDFYINRIITAIPEINNAFPQFPNPQNLAIIETRFAFLYRTESCINNNNNCILREHFTIPSLTYQPY